MEAKKYTYLNVLKETNYRNIPDADIKFTESQNVVILPFLYLGSGAIRRAGGVLNDREEYIEESGSRKGYLKYGRAYQYDNSNIEFVNEEVIWFGYFYSHWGHFIIELIGRMWFLLENYNGQKIIYISQDGDEFGGVFLEFMNYLGVAAEKIVKITKPIAFAKIIIPDYAATEYYYSSQYIKLLDKVIANSDYENCTFPKYENIYLSRKKVSDSKIKDFGEKEIEKQFEKNGFVSVSPEKLSLREQINLWNRTRNIACINGTLPLNIVFNRTKINLVVLNKTDIVHEALISIHKVFNKSNIIYIDVFYEKYKSLTKNIGVGPFFLYRSSKFSEFLKDNHYKGFRDASFHNLRMKAYYVKYKIYKIYGDYYYLIPKYYYKLKKRFLKT